MARFNILHLHSTSAVADAGVDLLILLGVARPDRQQTHHQVYICVLPAAICGQMVVMYTNVHELPYWLKIADAIPR